MSKKGATKRQHYVPRFVLKRFSPDGGTTGILVVTTGKTVTKGPLKNQCYGDYFYGPDQVMEKSFAKSEGEVSKILGDLSPAHLNALDLKALGKLRFFVHYQLSRTQGAVEAQTEFVASMMRNAALTKAELEGRPLSKDAMERVRVVNPNGVNDAVWHASKSAPITSDLQIRFLKAPEKASFIIGDHPVVAYNLFAERHPILGKWPNITGLAVMGLQLIMPLSSEMALMAFDPEAYEFAVPHRVCNIGKRDVLHVNRMQAVNAWRSAYFDPTKVSRDTLDQLMLARRDHPDVHRSQTEEVEWQDHGDGRMSQFTVTIPNEVRVNARFSFLRAVDQFDFSGYDLAHIPFRSPTLVAHTMAYGERLERAVKDGKGFEELAEALRQEMEQEAKQK